MGFGVFARPAKNSGGGSEVRSMSIPASTRGWNARDSVSEMPDDMALTLTNIFPSPTNIQVRQGSAAWFATGYNNPAVPVNTLMAYRPLSGSQKLFATRGTAIYDVSAASSPPAVLSYHGWSYVSISGTFTGATLTGLAGATTYLATVTVDGTPHAISILGSTATTYAALVTQLQTQIGAGNALVTLVPASIGVITPNGIFITSLTIGTGSTVLIADGAPALFGSLTGFVGIGPNTAGTATQVTGLTNGLFWQYVNVATQGLTYLFACNGTDNMRRYDSTNGWVDTNLNAVGQQITGLPGGVNSVANVALTHTRLWFVVNNANIVYFLGANSIAGAVSNLDLGPLLDKGGKIIAVGGWSRDAGIGMQEYTVFISSQGQAIVYQGIDPTNAALWQLVGVYNIGRPVGNNCMLRLADDLLILTTDGIVPASKAFITDRTNNRINVTTNIQNAVVSAISSLKATTNGWQMIFYPEGQQLILNTPAGNGFGQQFVMNTIHKAWALFTGWSARSLALFNDAGVYSSVTSDILMYADEFGNIAYTSADPAFYNLFNSDFNGSMVGGSYPVIAEWQPAFNYISSDKFRAKEVCMLRPNMVYTDSTAFTMQLSLNYDFVTTPATGTIILPVVTSGISSSLNVVTGTNPKFRMAWLGLSAVGVAFAPHFFLTVNGVNRTWFNAIDILWRPAGFQVS